jgi:hypothetical protein
MDLEPRHNQAICEEIGWLLRTGLSPERATMPYELRQLLHRLEEADRRLPARFSSFGTPDLPLDVWHDFATDKPVEAWVAKPATKVKILPPDEIFLGLAVAGIVLLFEICVLVLLAD